MTDIDKVIILTSIYLVFVCIYWLRIARPAGAMFTKVSLASMAVVVAARLTWGMI